MHPKLGVLVPGKTINPFIVSTNAELEFFWVFVVGSVFLEFD
jgi:hypothetical protein